jgi:outer membrane protein assembly factor BamA
MKHSVWLLLLMLVWITTGCSNTRCLTGDQKLYTGTEEIDIINPHNIKNTLAIRNKAKEVTSYKVNNALFEYRVIPPVGLWVNNYVKPTKPKGFKRWIYKTFSTQPVLVSDVNPELRAKKIENSLFDMGYFGAKATSKVITSPRNAHKAKVTYTIELTPPFCYRSIIFDNPVDQTDTLINESNSNIPINTGDQFDFTAIQAMRSNLSLKLQNRGYYYFNQDFIRTRVDTTVGNHQMDLLIGKKAGIPPQALQPYLINNITIKIYKSSTDSATICDTTTYNNITIISDGFILKPEVLTSAIAFKPGDSYTNKAYDLTTNHLNNLGLFKSVRIDYLRTTADTLKNRLNVVVDLLTSDNIMVDFEGNMVSKSSGFSGPAASVGISHRNAFSGAEKLYAKVNGSFEWQWGNKSVSQLGTHSYEFGISSGLSLPRIVAPFNIRPSKQLLSNYTDINLGYSILNRVSYYKMYSASFNLNYQWSKRKAINHSFTPFHFNSVNLLQTTAAFDSIVAKDVYIRKSFEEQFILGVKYDFSYNDTYKTRPHNFFFQTGLSTSGLLLDLLARRGKSESERPFVFLNNIYSQFIKYTSDFRYYRNGYNKSLVCRVYAGIGIPFKNSSSLPYVEQFYSGGAYSIRGFTARSLGPGSYRETNSDYIDQSGDLKLESNLEFRFKMSSMLHGALFLEAGNIWLINPDESRPGADFQLKNFANELAVGSGFGLRFDFSFFILRTDVGVPLRTPYKVNNSNWLQMNDIMKGTLFHLAIGYPF